MTATLETPFIGDRLDRERFSPETDTSQNLALADDSQIELKLLDPNGDPWPDKIPTSDVIAIPSEKVRSETLPGYGTVWKSQWAMSDGTEYKVHILEPEKLKTEVPVLDGTPLGTQPEGYNTDAARKILQAGMRVILVGPEINASLPLWQTAHNVHAILTEVNRIGRYGGDLIAVHGYSRSSMYGFGVVAMAGRHGRQVVDAQLVDPCVAKYIPYNVTTALEVARKLPADAVSGALAIARVVINPVRAYHYRHSVDFTPRGLGQFRRTYRPLITGEAGYLASQIPPEARVLVDFFSDCATNHKDTYRAILNKRQHPGVDINDYSGGHLKHLDQERLNMVGAHFAELASQLAEERTPEELDYTRLHARQMAA